MAKPHDIAAHIDASEKEIALFALRLDTFIGKNLDKILAGIKAGKVSAQQAGALLVSLDDELKKAGLSDLIRRSVRDSYARELSFVKESLSHLKPDEIFTEADRTLVETLVTFKTEDIGATVDVKLGSLREQTMNAVLGGEKPDFRAIWDDLGPTMATRIESELNTSVAAFNRTITVKKGKELGFDLYEYIGPVDKLTRPFCLCAMNKKDGAEFNIPKRDVPIYTLAEISKMDNGSGLDPLIYGGGYNCRHQWRPIKEESAISEGYKP